MPLYLIAAIMWLAPGLPHEKVQQYADLIHFEAMWYRVDPLVLVSLIQVESRWNTRKRSVTNDFGLGQIHVAKRGSGDFYGREKMLYNPRVNIREAARIAAMWREYHTKWCRGAHPYWAHYKYGKRVKADISHAIKVKALLDLLRKKFRPNRPVPVAQPNA